MRKRIYLAFLALAAVPVLAQQTSSDLAKCEAEAKRQHEIAERERYLSTADEIATQSAEIADNELSGLLAIQAFNFNKKYNGYTYNSRIYWGLAGSLKRFEPVPTNADKGEFAPGRIPTDTIHLKKRLDIFIFRIRKIVFNNAGTMIAAICSDGKVRIWNLKQINEPSLLIPEGDAIEGVAFTADDSQVICKVKSPQKTDGGYHAYPIHLADIVEKLRKFMKHNMTKSEWENCVGSLMYESTVPGLPDNNK